MSTKWFWRLLTVLLVFNLVLAGAYYLNRRQSRIRVISEIPNLKIKGVDFKLADEMFARMGIWAEGMHSTEDYVQVWPEQVVFVLTDQPQGMKYRKDGQDWASVGYDYDARTSRMEIRLQYSQAFQQEQGPDGLAKQISQAMLYEPFILGKERLIEDPGDYEHYDYLGRTQAERYLENRALVKLARKGADAK